MTRLRLVAIVAGSLVSFVSLSDALAQPKPRAQTSGAFDKLSAGNQKVASSLHLAQKSAAPAPSSTAQPVKPLTLDELAAMHLSGQPWSTVFKDLKAQGLVHEKSLGQVVSKYGRVGEPGAKTSGATSGTISAFGVGSPGSGGGAAHGNGRGGK